MILTAIEWDMKTKDIAHKWFHTVYILHPGPEVAVV